MIHRVASLCLAFVSTLAAFAATPAAPAVRMTPDGLVLPKRPIVEGIADAMQFLRKADGDYVPGRLNGDLAGYFYSCLVNPDGTRHPKPLMFPARQHGYFIRTFLHYYAYTGEREYLQRAIDLAQWNLARRTPADSKLPNLPYSAYANGKPMGSADKDSTEPDKAAFIGTWFLALYESTGDAQYLEAARQIAATLLKTQRPDGSWPFRIKPDSFAIFEDFGGAPVFYVEFFDRLGRHESKPEYRRASEQAARYMIAANVKRGEWGNYHEDVAPRPRSHVTAEHMSFTADYLFRAAKRHPEYVEMGRKVLRQMEATLVHTEGHSASPAAGVSEQPTFAHIMPGHTARYAQALTNLHLASGDEASRRRALSSFNAVTYMQSPRGLFRTFFYDTKKKSDEDMGRPDWYSQHLYTVCHMLETMAAYPDRVPDGQDRILGFSTSLQNVRYASGKVSYATLLPTEVVVKLASAPKSVQAADRALKETKGALRDGEEGWSYDARTRVLTVRHAQGEVVVSR